MRSVPIAPTITATEAPIPTNPGWLQGNRLACDRPFREIRITLRMIGGPHNLEEMCVANAEAAHKMEEAATQNLGLWI